MQLGVIISYVFDDQLQLDIDSINVTFDEIVAPPNVAFVINSDGTVDVVELVDLRQCIKDAIKKGGK